MTEAQIDHWIRWVFAIIAAGTTWFFKKLWSYNEDLEVRLAAVESKIASFEAQHKLERLEDSNFRAELKDALLIINTKLDKIFQDERQHLLDQIKELKASIAEAKK